MRARAEIVITGAGVAGLALAAALARALGPGFGVAVCDPALASPPPADDRVSAIAAGARRLLQSVGAWQRLNEAQPIRQMSITDSRLEDVVRPEFLGFEGEVADGEPFAHMVENSALNRALREVAVETDVKLIPVSVESLEVGSDAISDHVPSGPIVGS